MVCWWNRIICGNRDEIVINVWFYEIKRDGRLGRGWRGGLIYELWKVSNGVIELVMGIVEFVSVLEVFFYGGDG